MTTLDRGVHDTDSSIRTMSVWEAASTLDMPVGQVYALCEVGTLAYVRRQIHVLQTAVEMLDNGTSEGSAAVEALPG